MVIDLMLRSGDFSCRKAHNRGHSQKRGEGHPHRLGADIGSRQSFRVDVRRRFLIEPNKVQGFSLKLLSPRSVGFQTYKGVTTGNMIHLNRIEQVWSATSRDEFGNGIFRDCSRALLSRPSD